MRASDSRRTAPPNSVVRMGRGQRSPLQEAAAPAWLLAAANSLSRNVEDTAADLIVLDLAGLNRLFGTPAAIARELSRRIAEVGQEANY